ncbi:MAG: helix-turn-helix transcriptional regulator [Elusimicrobiaceae bacterium]|nr:helix-turn-helix transcriptional regulator [Elusimicrobiaceae bacterium]
MAIIERIKEFIKAQGLNNSAFEKRAGLGNGYISKVKGSPSPEKCEDILRAFPELSREWLFTGRGEMLNPAAPVDSEPAEAAPVEDPAGFVSIPAEAWNVIKQQAASLERKDRQVDRVISLLEAALNETKKTGAAVPSGSFAPSGTGPGLVAGTKHP